MLKLLIISLAILIGCNKSSIDEITIINKNSTEIKLVYVQDKWILKDVPELPVNQEAGIVLNNLYEKLRNSKDDISISREKIGLIDPIVKVFFDREELRVGSLNNYLQKVYVEFNKRIFLLEPSFFKYIAQSNLAYLDRTILKPEDFVKIKIFNKDYNYEFIKQSNAWKRAAVDNFTVDQKFISHLLEDLSIKEAESLTNKNDKYVCDYKIQIVGNASHEFDYCSESQKKYLCNQQICYEISKIIQLPNQILGFARQTKIFPFERETISKVVFEGAEKYTLKKNNENWFVNDKSGDLPFVESFLKILTGVESLPSQDNLQIKALESLTVATETKEIKMLIGRCVPSSSANYCLSTPLYPDVFVISDKTYRQLFPEMQTLLKLD